MIDQKRFLNNLNNCGVDFFTGVPDSYLNGFCNSLLENIPEDKNIIAANEGNAIGIASGYYFSTKKVPLVYMQNSGIGNTINPIMSLADKDVYKVPMVLLIGWRGEPNTGDHSQHKMQGETTTKLMDLLEIPYIIAQDDDDLLEVQTKKLIEIAYAERKIVAIIAKKGVFAQIKKNTKPVQNGYPLFREEAIEIVLDCIPKDTICVATTGRATRELYYLRERRHETHDFDFLNVGSMGHASSVALGLAVQNPNQKVVCFDGDGATIMHLGALTMVSKMDVPNLFHVILNNGVHESVGNQPSAGMKVDFTTIAKGSGYKTIDSFVSTKSEIEQAVDKLMQENSATLLDIRIKKGLKEKLPDLKIESHEEMINSFIANIKK